MLTAAFAAFVGASKPSAVELASSVTAIGANTFATCPLLNELTLDDGVISIGDISFAYNDITEKADFKLNVMPGSYALYYAISNHLACNCDEIRTGTLDVSLLFSADGVTVSHTF